MADQEGVLPPLPPTMEERLVGTLGSLNTTMATLRTSYKASQMSSIITPYDGDATKAREWVSSVVKYSELIDEPNDDTRVRVAYMTAKGSVSDFIKRYVDARTLANPPQRVTWADLKRDILSHFSTVTDKDFAHDVLKKIKQGPTETVSFFVERIHRLAQDAYSEADMLGAGSRALAQRQLVSYFIDGILDVGVKLKLMRRNPNDLDEALAIAMEEATLIKRFQLRNPRHTNSAHLRPPHPVAPVPMEEPMEVDHVRQGRPRFGQYRRPDLPHRQPANAHQQRQRASQWRAEVQAVENERRCYYCNAPGHFKRDCIKFKKSKTADKSHYQRPGNRNGQTQSGN